jgi:hypothetical protein
MKKNNNESHDFIKFILGILYDEESTREIAKLWLFLLDKLEKRDYSNIKLLQTMSMDKKEELISDLLNTFNSEEDSYETNESQIVDSVIDSSMELGETSIGKQTSKELLDAFSAFNMFMKHDNLHFVENLSNLSYALATMMVERTILDDFIHWHGLPSDISDLFYKIRNVISSTYYSFEKLRLFMQENALKSETKFGVSSIPIRSLHVYERGYNFYSAASQTKSRLTLTASNTSGLFNPLERLGSEQFKRVIGETIRMDENNKPVKLPDKHSLRSMNFTDGILNRNIDCTRLYIWNKTNTIESFIFAWKQAENKEAFRNEVNKYLQEMKLMNDHGLLYCYELENFKSCSELENLTRLSENVMMWSNRHKKKKEIMHAIWFNFPDDYRTPSQRYIDQKSISWKLIYDMVSEYLPESHISRLFRIIYLFLPGMRDNIQMPKKWLEPLGDIRKVGNEPQAFINTLNTSINVELIPVNLDELTARLTNLMT